MQNLIGPFLLCMVTMAGVPCGVARAQTSEDRPHSRLALLPIIFSSPDTRLALGVLPQYIFYTAQETRPSNVRADVYYTFNRQFNVLVRPTVWFPGDRWQASADVRFRKWPTTFYGIGPDSPGDSTTRFTEFSVTGSAEALRMLRPRVYLGGGYTIRAARIRDVEPADSPLGNGTVPGAGNAVVAGLGIVATYDTREHVYLPRGGALYRLQADWFAPAFGSDRSFGRLSVDLRQYVHVAGPVTAALQATMTVTSGDVPFRMMPNVGEIVRGYAATRYLDRQRWAVNAEVRAIPAWWRLGLAVFGGVGSVASRIEDLGSSRLDWAVGVGIRVLMYPRERITVRWDYASGRGSSGDYLDLNEAY